MKTHFELWVRLKVIDLVAQTASITFTEKLDFAGRLHGLVRYAYWDMDAEGADPERILGEIDRVIRADSAFTNQNKHLYRLRSADGTRSRGDLALEKDFPVSGGGGGADALGKSRRTKGGRVAGKADAPGKAGAAAGTRLFAFDCLIRERMPDRETGYAERLASRLGGIALSNVRFGEVWRLIVAAPSREAALGDVERMLVSRTRREGLLLNPHYQHYEIIAAAELGEPGRSGASSPAKG